MKVFSRTTFAVLFLLSLSASIHAQSLKPGEWRSYTSMRNVQDVAADPDHIHAWVVTTGGAFRVNVTDSTEPVFALRATDGLAENNMTSVATDASGNVYFGGTSGGFTIYNGSSGKITSQNDIRDNKEIPAKTINRISVAGSRVYLSTTYGLTVYQSGNPGYFQTTVNRFTSRGIQDTIHEAIESGDNVYAVMNAGLLIAHKDAILNDASVWSIDTTPQPAIGVQEFGNAIYVATTRGLFKLSQDAQSLAAVQ